ncbi:MAG: NmrA family NAD(P)-binding protein [Actinomycetota bacterium]|nr:NmrA family NAD(P)-binding protein [Actinomycetota bacterium]
MNENTNLTLVIGGTGKTGRRVAERLTALGRPVRIGSRTAEPPFDWNDRSTWAEALRDVGSAYVTYYPDLAFPGAVDDVRQFAEVAVASGVERLVLLSGRGEEEARKAEDVVRQAGAEWTIVRASWFAQNFSEHFLLEPVLDGVIALPAGDVAEPFVDVDDIADIAVAALTRDGHSGQLYEVTGPRLLTFHDVATELTRAIGREVRYVAVTPAEYSAAAESFGVPREEAAALTELFTGVLDGRNASVTDGVQRALGRPPRDFADYARDAAATGVWNTSPSDPDER